MGKFSNMMIKVENEMFKNKISYREAVKNRKLEEFIDGKEELCEDI